MDGKIIQLGDSRLYLGDSRLIVPTLGDLQDKAQITDPPYGLGSRKIWRGGRRQWALQQNGEGMEWDNRIVPEVEDWVHQFRFSVVWGGQFYNLPISRCWLSWHKIVENWTASESEHAWTNFDKPNRNLPYSHGQLANEGKKHPTQKPLPIMEWCLHFLPPGITVVDPFMGSGTVGVACMNMGHPFIGIETRPDYFADAVDRIKDAQSRPVFPALLRKKKKTKDDRPTFFDDHPRDVA